MNRLTACSCPAFTLFHGEIVGARPDNARKRVRASASRPVGSRLNDASVSYERTLRVPLTVLYIPTPKRVFGRRLEVAEARRILHRRRIRSGPRPQVMVMVLKHGRADERVRTGHTRLRAGGACVSAFRRRRALGVPLHEELPG